MMTEVARRGTSRNTRKAIRVAPDNDAPSELAPAAFDEILEVVYPAAINSDRVHPDNVGSMVLARAFVNAIGFRW